MHRAQRDLFCLIFSELLELPVWAIIGVEIFWDHPVISGTAPLTGLRYSAFWSPWRELNFICWGQRRQAHGLRAMVAEVADHFFHHFWVVATLMLWRPHRSLDRYEFWTDCRKTKFTSLNLFVLHYLKSFLRGGGSKNTNFDKNRNIANFDAI